MAGTKTIVRKARQQHTCDICKKPIFKNAAYGKERIKKEVNGEVEYTNCKFHLACAKSFG